MERIRASVALGHRGGVAALSLAAAEASEPLYVLPLGPVTVSRRAQ